MDDIKALSLVLQAAKDRLNQLYRDIEEGPKGIEIYNQQERMDLQQAIPLVREQILKPMMVKEVKIG